LKLTEALVVDTSFTVSTFSVRLATNSTDEVLTNLAISTVIVPSANGLAHSVVTLLAWQAVVVG
jgi:hypothetical protein